MHYFLLINFNIKPLHVSSWLATHHQEDQLCINTNCCLYTVDPPDDEQQDCSKHVEAYY